MIIYFCTEIRIDQNNKINFMSVLFPSSLYKTAPISSRLLFRIKPKSLELYVIQDRGKQVHVFQADQISSQK